MFEQTNNPVQTSLPIVPAHERPAWFMETFMGGAILLIGLTFLAVGVSNFSTGPISLGGLLAYTAAVAICLALSSWILYGLLKRQLRHRQIMKAFAKEGQVAQARILEKESNTDDDNADFYIYYQFRSDFIVKAQDKTWGNVYYDLPKGGSLEVEFLPSNPRISRLKKIKKPS